MKILGVALALALAWGCSKTDASQAGSGVDNQISDRVREAMLADRQLAAEAGTVLVSTRDGVVSLSGTVRSEEVRKRLVVVVRAVGSVVKVQDGLVVVPDPTAPPVPMESAVDRAISERVRLAFENDSTLRRELPSILVSSREGVVALEGTVSSLAVRDRAGVLARSVGSVVRVDNRLAVPGDAR